MNLTDIMWRFRWWLRRRRGWVPPPSTWSAPPTQASSDSVSAAVLNDARANLEAMEERVDAVVAAADRQVHQ